MPPITLNGTTGYIGPDGSAATPAIQGSDANTGMFFPAADTIAFAEGGAEVARFDSSGNLGLGVTPSAWVGGQAVQIGARAGSFYRTDLTSTELSNNSYFNSGVGYVYQASAAATLYRQSSGAHSWFIASSGTAGNTTNYTQAMALDNFGNLLVGTTTTFYNGRANFQNSNAGQIAFRHTAQAAGRLWYMGVESGNDVFIVYSDGGGGVYLTRGATSWTGNSDERLKTNLQPIENATQKVLQLRAVTGRFKTDEEGVSRAFLIAQDVQAVLPEAVDVRDDEQGTLGVRYTDTIPLLVAAIKEQQAMIVALKAEVDALKAQLGAQA